MCSMNRTGLAEVKSSIVKILLATGSVSAWSGVEVSPSGVMMTLSRIEPHVEGCVSLIITKVLRYGGIEALELE